MRKLSSSRAPVRTAFALARPYASSPSRSTTSSLRPRTLTLAIRIGLLSLAAVAIVPAVTQSAMAQTIAERGRAYDLPAAPLSDSLSRLAAQAGVTLQVNSALLQGLRAPRLDGTYTMEQALGRLLDGSGLEVVRTVGGAYIVQKRTAAPEAAAAAGAGGPALPEIVVRATRARQSAGSTTVIGSEDLARRDVGSMADVVRYEPLISAPGSASGGGSIWDSSGTTGYNIRGVEGNRVSLDVDGIALPDAAPKPDANTVNSFGIGRDYIDPEMFREVRIDSGTSASGRAGGANLGGGVVFVTKSPEDYLSDGKKLYAAYKLGYQSANESYASTLTGAAQLADTLQGLVVYTHRDGTQTRNNSDVAPNPDSWSSNAALIKFIWTPGAQHKLGLTIDHYDRNSHPVFVNKFSTLYPQGANQDVTTRRTRVSVEDTYTPTGLALFDALTTRLYVQDSKVDDITNALYTFGTPGYRRISTGFYNKSVGANVDAVKQLDAQNRLSYGVALNRTRSSRPWLEDRTIVATGQHQITVKDRMADVDTNKFDAFIRDEFSFDIGGHQATLAPGLRGEYRKMSPNSTAGYAVAIAGAAAQVKQRSDSFFTPSLALSVELAPDFDAYAQYARGTRLPTASELTGTYDSFSYTGAGNGYAVLGNADLKKETSDAFEIGLKGKPAAGLTMRSAVFYTRYKDFIEYVQQAADPVNFPTITQGLYRPQNIGRATIWGAEASARFDLGAWSKPLAGFSISPALGVAKGNAQNGSTGKSSGLASVAPAKGSLTLAYDDPAQVFGTALTVTHVNGKKAEDDVISGVTTARFAVPAYTLLDASGYWNITPRAKLNLGIYNLFNRKYWDYASVRGLAAPTTAAAIYDVEQQTQPGRSFFASLAVNF